ncbi:MAG TPA: BlaI/MecI/CopY family transcriptional regulator [Thermoanaerobaculia bacterium]|nr:BlaI/MecI/CopY family transcriptional regulator [Thermoanaerobaculia bacterium]
MPRKPGSLTEVELEIMHVVWELGDATVKQVHDVLSARRPVAYTTVMTMLGLLAKKGHLKREESGKAFVYRPAHTKGRVVSKMLDDFVSRVFHGSARPLVLALLKDRKISKRDLEEIAKLAEVDE